MKANEIIYIRFDGGNIVILRTLVYFIFNFLLLLV